MAVFKNIRVIGFDLDQTLYPKSPEVDKKIQSYIVERIAKNKGTTLREAEKLFSDLYREGRGLSGRKTLIALGIPSAGGIVQEALERADIASVLSPDVQTLTLLKDLSLRYNSLDLITGSHRKETEKKLRALGIPLQMFGHIITEEVKSKSDGAAYVYWLSLYPTCTPSQFLYVGDRSSDSTVPHTLGIQTALVNIKTRDPALSCPQYTSLKDLREVLLSR